MKLKPRPPFDPESAPLRPWIRGWVQFSAVVMVLQCLANIALFRVHAFDITFSGLVMVTAGLCFGAWRWRELRFLAGFWIMLSLLGWVGVAFLSYYSALAIHAERTAPPVPERLIRQAPPPEDVAAFEEMMRRFPPTVEDGADAELLESLKLLGDLRSRVKSEDSPASWDEVFAEPETEAAIARAKPYLAEYFAFMEVHQPTLAEYTYGTSMPYIMHLSDCAKAELAICRQLALHHETLSESRAIMERLLRSVACQLESETPLVSVLVCLQVLTQVGVFIEEAPLSYFSPESTTRQVDLLRACQSRLEPAFKQTLRQEIPPFEKMLNDRLDFAELNEPSEKEVDVSRWTRIRLSYWPFNVPKYSISNLAQDLDRSFRAFDMDPLEGYHLVNQEMEFPSNRRELLMAPALYSELTRRIVAPILGSIWTRVVQAESRLTALSNAMNWQIAGSRGEVFNAEQMEPDPMTNAPFHMQVIVENELERLILAGGHPQIGKTTSSEEEQLKHYGLEDKALYVIEVTRPIPPAAAQ